MSAKRHSSLAFHIGTAMENRLSNRVLFYRPDIEQAHEQAKVLRSQFFRENENLLTRGLLAGVVVCALAVMVTFGGRSASQRALEGTVFMERLTTRLESAKTIAPETVREISQLLQKPAYDCNQLACDATLERRNRVARDHLKSALNRPVRSNELADSKGTKTRPSEVDHASTAGAVVTQQQSIR